jgi:hypothetical protein
MSVTGDLHILRADRATDPEPWTFFVRFEPHGGEWIDRTCVGLLALGSLLRSLGLSRRTLANIMVDVERSGRYALQDVTLSDEQLRRLQ